MTEARIIPPSLLTLDMILIKADCFNLACESVVVD